MSLYIINGVDEPSKGVNNYNNTAVLRIIQGECLTSLPELYDQETLTAFVIASLGVLNPACNDLHLLLPRLSHIGWVGFIGEHEIDVMRSRGDRDRMHRFRRALEHASSAPWIERSVREDDLGSVSDALPASRPLVLLLDRLPRLRCRCIDFLPPTCDFPFTPPFCCAAS